MDCLLPDEIDNRFATWDRSDLTGLQVLEQLLPGSAPLPWQRQSDSRNGRCKTRDSSGAHHQWIRGPPDGIRQAPGVTAGRENPYEHHGSAVRGGSRSERNMLRAITGGFTSLDRDTLEQLSQLLAA